MPGEQGGWTTNHADMDELAGNQSAKLYAGLPHTIWDANWNFFK
jgi:hypothetical protein